MWPPQHDLIEQTLDAERAVEELYAQALLQWAPHAMHAALPTVALNVVTASGEELEPDPDAVLGLQPQWDALLDSIVLPGVAAVWTAAATAAAAAKTVGATISHVWSALKTPREQFLLSYGQGAARVPSMVRDGLRAAINQAHAQARAQTQALATRPELRAVVRDAVTPGSAMLRDTARQLGYQGSGILNDALMAVAKAGDADRKIWVSQLDDRTRDSHWIADGQVTVLDGAFTVGGTHMLFPGDPTAPPRETANCRCRLAVLAFGEAPPRRHVPKAEAARRAAKGVERGADIPDNPIAASAAQEDTMTDIDTVDTGLPGEAEQAVFRTFTDAVVAFIGTPTSDYRLLHNDIDLSIRSMPLPLMWCRQSKEGHSDSFTVGVIESARMEDGKVLESGYMLNTPEADEAIELLTHKVTRPSVDLSRAEWALTDADGNEISEEDFWDLPLNAKVFRTFTAAELIGTTLVSTPAFGDTLLTLDDERADRDSAALVAAAFAHVTPRAWPAGHFADPNLTEPTLPTLTEDGRVFGHIACWGQCHRSVQTACVMAPRSPTDYSHFHTSPAVRLDDDTRLPVGRLTVGTGHASDTLAGVPAQAHYDNTGTCWALVRVGEDRHGIWFSGVLAPWATPEQIEAGLAAPLSGDWRDFGQGLELVAALSVNTPGFAARGREDDQGRPLALVAALGPGPRTPAQGLTRDDVIAAVSQALSARDFAAARDAALARADLVAPAVPPREQIAKLLTRAV